MTAVRPSGATYNLVVERDDGRCARCGEYVWGQRGLDFSLHHRRPAKSGGDSRPESHRAGNLVLLHGSGTTACHGEIESLRTVSYARGWLVREPLTPALQPVEHAIHGLVLLDDVGSWAEVG